MKENKIEPVLPFLVLLALIIYALSSCTTAKKATAYLNAHPDYISKECAIRYPVKEQTETSVTIDTSGYNSTVNDLLRYSDSLLFQLNTKMVYVDTLNSGRVIVYDSDGDTSFNYTFPKPVSGDEYGIFATPKPVVDIATLRKAIEAKVRAAIKPCHDTTITIVKENTAKVEYFRIENEKQKAENEKQIKKTEEVTASRDVWRKRFWICFAVAIGLGLFAFRKPLLALL